MKHFEIAMPLGQTMLALIATAMLSGCSEHPSPVPQPTTAATTALDSAQAPQAEPAPQATSAPQDRLRAHAAPGGVPTEYVAYFAAGQLQRIAETRWPDGSDAANGEYIFYGARLTQYQGAALNSAAHIELTFDLQGALTAANSSTGNTIDDATVAAIRNRAQLLRSLTLARHATRSHTH